MGHARTPSRNARRHPRLKTHPGNVLTLIMGLSPLGRGRANPKTLFPPGWSSSGPLGSNSPHLGSLGHVPYAAAHRPPWPPAPDKDGGIRPETGNTTAKPGLRPAVRVAFARGRPTLRAARIGPQRPSVCWGNPVPNGTSATRSQVHNWSGACAMRLIAVTAAFRLGNSRPSASITGSAGPAALL